MMQPQAQRSTGALYAVLWSSTSGARYHRVDTYSVKGGRDRISRARPKSQICRRARVSGGGGGGAGPGLATRRGAAAHLGEVARDHDVFRLHVPAVLFMPP